MKNRETVNVTSGKRLMRSLFSGSMALVLATLTTEVWAQSGAENVDGSDAQGSMPLSAAIADMRRSPFYTSESLVPLGSNMAGLLWAPLAVGSPGSSIRWAVNDSTFPARRVFLAALGSSALTVYPAVVLTYMAAYYNSVPRLAAAFVLPAFGVAGGATLAGARFGPALMGSALGVAAGWAAFIAAVSLVGEDSDFRVFFVLGPVIQAAVTTVIASRFN